MSPPALIEPCWFATLYLHVTPYDAPTDHPVTSSSFFTASYPGSEDSITDHVPEW